MMTQKYVLCKERNVSVNVLLHDETNDDALLPVMVVLPGGGYGMLSDREAEPVAEEYYAAGYQAFVLRYTISDKSQTPVKTCWPRPLQDYELLLGFLKENADKWHLDLQRIAVVGFSAGAHLAAMIGCEASLRPEAVLLGYPVILQEACDICVPGLPLPIEHIDDKTPPCFIFQAQDDSMVSALNSYAWAEALQKKNIPYELHMYSKGEHGFTTGRQELLIMPACSRISNWIADSIEFLKELR